MDIIFIRDLQIETIIGIHAWERLVPQLIRLDIEIATDGAKASRTDSIADAIDYDAIAKRLQAFISTASFHLLETLAEQTAQLLLDEFGLTWLKLKISKPGAIANAKDVGIIIERTQH